MYEINRTLDPPSCLPVELERENLRDITAIGDHWRKYLDIKTGQIHDGAVYVQLAWEELEDKIREWR